MVGVAIPPKGIPDSNSSEGSSHALVRDNLICNCGCGLCRCEVAEVTPVTAVQNSLQATRLNDSVVSGNTPPQGQRSQVYRTSYDMFICVFV